MKRSANAADKRQAPLMQLPADLASGNRPLILAHRGCRARAPENTMPAFVLALEQGADIIETDLRITRDRVIVCIHDATVDRTTDGTGRVDELSWEEIRRLRARGDNSVGPSSPDVGRRSPDRALYPEARVPSLAEVLEALAPRAYLALELKAPVFTSSADVELLLDTLARYSALDRILALSFSREALNRLEQAHAPYPLGLITALNPWPPARYPLVGPWWPLLLVNPFYVAIAHRRGQFCCPLDPRPEPRLSLYLRLGVDALLSDDPALTRQALKGFLPPGHKDTM